MLNLRLILSIFLSSSATLALAAENQGSLILNHSSWQDLLPASIDANENSAPIHLGVLESGVSGTFKYNITNLDDALPYYFQIKLENGVCQLDAAHSELENNKQGHWVYHVDIEPPAEVGPGVTNCDITVTATPNEPIIHYPKLQLTPYSKSRFLNVGLSVCSEGGKGIRVSDVKPFTYNNNNGVKEYYVAVAATDFACSDGKTSAVVIYKWQNDQFNHFTTITRNSTGNFFRISAVEFFESKDEGGDNYGILAISDYSDSNYDTTKAKTVLYTFYGTNFSEQDASKILYGDGTKDLEHFKLNDNNFMVVVNQGSRISGYANESHVYKWHNGNKEFDKERKQTIETFGAQKATFFNFASQNQNSIDNFIGLANRNTESSFDLEHQAGIYEARDADVPLTLFENELRTWGNTRWEHFAVPYWQNDATIMSDFILSTNSYQDASPHTDTWFRLYQFSNSEPPFPLFKEEYSPVSGVTAWKTIPWKGEIYLFAARNNSHGAALQWCPQTKIAPTHYCGPTERGSLVKYLDSENIPPDCSSSTGYPCLAAHDTTGWEWMEIGDKFLILRSISSIQDKSWLAEGVEIFTAEEQ